MIKYLFNHHSRSIIQKKAHVNITKAFPPNGRKVFPFGRNAGRTDDR